MIRNQRKGMNMRIMYELKIRFLCVNFKVVPTFARRNITRGLRKPKKPNATSARRKTGMNTRKLNGNGRIKKGTKTMRN